jgi:hypothetical protein
MFIMDVTPSLDLPGSLRGACRGDNNSGEAR